MPSRVPRATYRLQFNRHFTFDDAREIAEYLRDLGISDCYASPLFHAAPQSTHGYDVCGFGQLNPHLGSPSSFEGFTRHLQKLGLGLLLDMVPNHMAADLSNPWWADVLEKGRASRFASWFDIDWQPPGSPIDGKVILPILEDHYVKVLEAGKLKIVCEEGTAALAYGERRFPLSSESVGLLPQPGGKAGDASLSVSQTHSVVSRQHYRLAFWRTGSEEINYRRFFDVTDLVSLRMELPEVFEEAHQLIFRLLRERTITGLRIDHPDGLWDPKEYLERLQAGYEKDGADCPLYIVAEKILTGEEPPRKDWPIAGTTGYDFLNQANALFVDSRNKAAFDSLYQQFSGVTESFTELVYSAKKLVLGSSLVSDLNTAVQRLKQIAVVSRDAEDLSLRELKAALTEFAANFPVYRSYIQEGTTQVSPADREVIELALETAHRGKPGLEPLALEFIRKLFLDTPDDLDEPTRKRARRFVMRFQQLTGPVMAKAVEDTAFYNYNRLVSLNEVGGDPDRFGASPAEFHEWNQARLRRWGHSLLATATHDTKRGEDLRARLNVLSEMPGEWREALQRWNELNAPRKGLVRNQPAPHPNDEYLFYQTLIGAWTPSANSPADLDLLRHRISAYMIKALREGKARTTWTDPDAAYEEAVRRFVETVLDHQTNETFLRNFQQFQSKVAFFGVFNSLSQMVLKLTCPGVPDYYQGTELWDFNLVDPDNRRPVDFDVRRRMLEALRKRMPTEPEQRQAFCGRLLQEADSGEIKLFTIWRTLQFRQAHPDLFEQGSYLPLHSVGSKNDHLCAFARQLAEKSMVVIVPRLVFGLTSGALHPPLGPDVWQDTELRLPEGNYQDLFSGRSFQCQAPEGQLRLSEALSSFPVAILTTCQA